MKRIALTLLLSLVITLVIQTTRGAEACQFEDTDCWQGRDPGTMPGEPTPDPEPDPGDPPVGEDCDGCVLSDRDEDRDTGDGDDDSGG